MNEDRIEGVATEAGGKVQEVAGKALDNQDTEARGIINQAKGRVQESYGRVKDKVKGAIDEAPGTARGAIDAGRDYARRGSQVVTRTVGDNTALALFAAGVAGAALGWMLGRRGGPRE